MYSLLKTPPCVTSIQWCWFLPTIAYDTITWPNSTQIWLDFASLFCDCEFVNCDCEFVHCEFVNLWIVNCEFMNCEFVNCDWGHTSQYVVYSYYKPICHGLYQLVYVCQGLLFPTSFLSNAMTTHCKHDIVTFLADKDCLINLRFFRFGARLEVFFGF